MSEWSENNLGSFVSFYKGKKVDTCEYQRDGYKRYLGASGLDGKNDGYASTQLAVLANPNDILMLWDGERSGLVGYQQSGVVASTVSKLVVNNEINSNYLYFYLSNSFEWIQQRRTGTGVPHVPKDLGRIFRVKYPLNIRAQQKIATILTSIDTAIEKTEALIEKYQQIKSGLMHDLFTRGVLPNGQLRPTREQAPELYQETKIGWIPKEWGIEIIGKLFDIQLGKMLSQKSKSGKYSAYYLGNKNVQWGSVDFSNLETMDFSPAEREKFSLKMDDLLVCEGGDVGRTSIWKMEIENCYYQKAIHRLRPKVEFISPRFMFYFIWYTKSSGGFSDYISQTSIAHLTQEKLSKVPTFLPTIEEQLLFVKKLDAMELLLDSEENKLKKFKSVKLGLMQDLLTGKVPVTVSENAEIKEKAYE